MAKSVTINFRLEPDDHAALCRAAEADERKVAALASKIVAGWLRENGWAEARKPRPAVLNEANP